MSPEKLLVSFRGQLGKRTLFVLVPAVCGFVHVVDKVLPIFLDLLPLFLTLFGMCLFSLPEPIAVLIVDFIPFGGLDCFRYEVRT